MKRSRVAFGLVLVAFVLYACPRVQASSLALSSITATDLRITLASAPASGQTALDVFTTLAFAQAQNSLGELDQAFDTQVGVPANADALVTWAEGHATSGDGSVVPWKASSLVNLPGSGNEAASLGQGTWIDSFVITGGVGAVSVNFAVDLSGLLQLATDSSGLLAETETIFTLLLEGDTVLSDDRPRSIGPNATLLEPFSLTLTGSRDLMFNTSYSLLLRVDSESHAINAAVPEPSTITLLGLGVAWCCRRMRGRMQPDGSRVPPA
jgi:hypothetical protein